MPPVETPACAVGTSAPTFLLPGTDGKTYTLENCRGPKGLLVMFICNHCPYVKGVRERIIRDAIDLQKLSIGVVAISANDPGDYPEDSFEVMKLVAQQYRYPFPHLFDETQDCATAYDAVCTRDFFGYNAELKLQYRRRLDASGKDAVPGARRELYDAMQQIAQTGRGPGEQVPSMGCSIKW